MTNTTKKGTFPKGRSGKPSGRPVGAGPAAAWRAALGKDVGKIIAVVTKLALAGDAACCRLILERSVPAYRPIDMPTPLPAMPTAATLNERAAAALDAMQAGLLSPQAAASLVTALASMVRATEQNEVERRLAALEADARKESDHA